jgi:hypothetical protein
MVTQAHAGACGRTFPSAAAPVLGEGLSWGRRRKWTALALLPVLSAGCAQPPPRPPPAPAPAPAEAGAARPTAPGPIPAGARRYEIDPERTVVQILVHRAGPLARLGHDHVISSSDETGRVWVGEQPSGSGFHLALPVERFEVDQPQARAQAGPRFAAEVPQSARDGTRANMLRPEVLDAARYPAVTVRSIGVNGPWAQPTVDVAVTLKGVEHRYQALVALERAADSVVARGTLRLNQSDFGIEPFAVAGGAIQVADELEVHFEILADAHGATATPPHQ